MGGVHQLRAKSKQIPFPEELFADAIDAGEFFLAGDFFLGGLAGVGFERFFLLIMLGAQGLHVFLIIVGGDQLILAAREKSDEVADEFAGILQAAKKFQVEFADIAAEQNFVVDIVERLDVGIGGAQNLFETKGVEGAEPDAFGALADGFHHAVLHLVRGFVGEGQAENIFAGEVRVGSEKIADAFDDDAGLASAGAGDDEKGTVAVFNGALLGRVEAGGGGRFFLGAHGSAGILRYVIRFTGGENEANIAEGWF